MAVDSLLEVLGRPPPTAAEEAEDHQCAGACRWVCSGCVRNAVAALKPSDCAELRTAAAAALEAAAGGRSAKRLETVRAAWLALGAVALSSRGVVDRSAAAAAAVADLRECMVPSPHADFTSADRWFQSRAAAAQSILACVQSLLHLGPPDCPLRAAELRAVVQQLAAKHHEDSAPSARLLKGVWTTRRSARLHAACLRVLVLQAGDEADAAAAGAAAAGCVMARLWSEQEDDAGFDFDAEKDVSAASAMLLALTRSPRVADLVAAGAVEDFFAPLLHAAADSFPPPRHGCAWATLPGSGPVPCPVLMCRCVASICSGAAGAAACAKAGAAEMLLRVVRTREEARVPALLALFLMSVTKAARGAVAGLRGVDRVAAELSESGDASTRDAAANLHASLHRDSIPGLLFVLGHVRGVPLQLLADAALPFLFTARLHELAVLR